MTFIAPFRGVRFNPAKISCLEEVITPPYDVINHRTQDIYRNKNPHNMIHLDLCVKHTPEPLAESHYEQARDLFEQWQQDQVLIRDETPAMYLYFIDYLRPGRKRLTRKGFMTLVRLAELDEGIVKPHEQTFQVVTSDRLRLMETCNAQFSQIFSLYSDIEAQVIEWLTAARPDEPLCSVIDEQGNVHRLWQITDSETLRKVQAFMADKPLYIADGHHRYTTALRLREKLKERNNTLPEDSPFNYTVMYLTAMEDQGLSILPTHRLVRIPGGLPLSLFIKRLAPYFDIRSVGGGSREGLIVEVLSQMEEYADSATMFGVYQADEDECYLLTLRPGTMKALFKDSIPQALVDLDVVVLSELVLGQVLGLTPERCVKENLVRYLSDPDDAVDMAVKETSDQEPYGGLLFLMNPTQVSQVQRVADEGLIMPHKSTFFYPKIITGLLMNKMVADEKVAM